MGKANKILINNILESYDKLKTIQSMELCSNNVSDMKGNIIDFNDKKKIKCKTCSDKSTCPKYIHSLNPIQTESGKDVIKQADFKTLQVLMDFNMELCNMSDIIRQQAGLIDDLNDMLNQLIN